MAPTVTDLVARFHDPTSGRILLNGTDIRDLRLRTYRGLLALVQQDVFLFDGSVRDTPQIGRLQFPVFSRGVAPSTTINHFRFAGVNIPVTCAGARVNPGDIIVADEDGVAVVPRAKADEVLKKAQALDDTEHSMLPFIEKFRSIKEAVAKFGRI